MFNPKHFLALALFVVVLNGCKKDSSPHPSAANNTIVEVLPPTQKGITVNINQYIGGYYESLPNHYPVTTKSYPLLISLHGGGQVGDGDKDLPLVLNDGVAKEINLKVFPPSFNVNGNDYAFIVLSPQLRALPPDSMVLSFLKYALAHYRIDPSRIYITGISMGGVLTTEMAGHYTSLFAAAVPIAGASFGDDETSNAANIAHGGVALWAFHNSDDPIISSQVAINFVNQVNSNNPLVPAKLTLFQASGHDAWTQALNPLYKENNMNVYEWMLQYKK